MSEPQVDVIVPVYRGLEETRCTLESVLASGCRTPFELIAINDASPEPELAEWLRDFAADNGVTLLENAENIGFVATVNRGMSLHGDRDVVLLNSDTEVANDWLDRLHHAARGRRTASVTPFSNNASICSYPRFCEDNPLPAGWSTAALDGLFASVNAGKTVGIPTAVGFCMYIRRDCLDAVGLFDTERFGKGYGEENEFCMRAARRGWKHKLAADCFVRHAGAVSFGGSRDLRQQVASQALLAIHPDYDERIRRFIRDDPPRLLRGTVDIARLLADGQPVVLQVVHALGGGTLRHVQDLARTLKDRVAMLMLTSVAGRPDRLRLFRPDVEEGLDLTLDPGPKCRDLIRLLRAIGVARIHFQHLISLPDSIRGLPQALGVGYDVTLHDFYFFCPQVHLTNEHGRYCGEPDRDGCAACVALRPIGGGLGIDQWRARCHDFLAGAEQIFAPSRAVVERMGRHFPDVEFTHAPHPEPIEDVDPRTRVPPLGAHEPLRIMVLGALSKSKGADLLEALAVQAQQRGVPLELTLLGFAYRKLQRYPETDLVVSGQYADESIPGWLRRVRPHLVWFPAQVPETYSYTLSACKAHGVPVAVTDMGALPERVAGRPWSWVLPADAEPAEWLAFFERIREENFLAGEPPAVAMPSSQPIIGTAVFDYHRDYQAPAIDPKSPRAAEALDIVRRIGQPSWGHLHELRRSVVKVGSRFNHDSLLRSTFRRLPNPVQSRLRYWVLGVRQ